VTRGVAAVAAALLLAACASAPRRAADGPAPPGAEPAQQAREARVQAQPEWWLQGRIAVSTGREGGSGRLEWTRRGDGYELRVSAPVTRQSWRLAVAGGRARIEGLTGGPREGDDPETLLRDATGWTIPLTALPYWARGARAPVAPAQVRYGPDGRPLRIEQAGWAIDYVWPDSADAEFPARIDARRDGARVRLAIDQARLGPESADPS